MDCRQVGANMLSTVVSKTNNVKVLEKAVYDRVGEDEDMYLWSIYQIVGILSEQSPNRIVQALSDVKENKLGWNSSFYTDVSSKIEEFDNYLVHPFEVVEGVTKCPKCHKNKTWSIQKQTRSSDEPMTTFSRCAECGHQWSYAG